jgi:Lysyl oxidase/WD40-like Beta Propeller Repeat
MRQTLLALAALSVLAAGLGAAALSLAASPAPGNPAPWATLVFSRSEIVGGGIFLVGSGRPRLLAESGVDPRWSPDGRRVVYVAPGAGGAGDLYVVDADGSHKGRITDTEGLDESAPDWSPDGMRLVAERAGRIVVLRADGIGMRRLAAGSQPAWSPGGTRIAYTDGNDLFIVPAAGGAVRRVAAVPGAQTSPSWSPDGRRLVYASDETGLSEIVVRDLRTGAVTPLTADEFVDSAPVFSENGRNVLYVSNRGGIETLWRVPAGGGPALPIVDTTYIARAAPRPEPPVAELLPDLEQRPPADLSVREVLRGGRRHFLLGFDSATDNVGLGPVMLAARRASHSTPFMRVSQLSRLAGGGRRTFQRVGLLRYVRSPTHDHWHVMGFQRYELRRVSDNAVLERDHKSGFCLADHYAHAPGQLAYEPRGPVFLGYCERGNPSALAVFQGTSVGYTDRYPSYFHGQNLDLTGIPAGNYVLVHRANKSLLVHELRYENNAASIRIRLRWPRGRTNAPAFEIVRTCPDSDRC